MNSSLMTSEQVWGARAKACELMSFSFQYPNEDLIESINSGEWISLAHELIAFFKLPLSDGWEKGLAPVELRPLRVEATRLFIGSPKPVVSPFEGVWRAQDDEVQPFLFVNPHSMEVERFCSSCGLGHPQDIYEPLDHVSTEFELLLYLTSIASGDGRFGETRFSENDFPGGSAAAAYEQFMVEHALIWIPRFAKKIEKESSMPFYRAVGRMLTVMIGEESSLEDCERNCL